MAPHGTPQLGTDTYLRDTFYDCTFTEGSREKEIWLPNWVTPMIRHLCRTLATSELAAQHIRNGVESVYQQDDLGEDYIPGAIDLTMSEEETRRKNNAITDNGRIKLISPAEDTLVPMVVALYFITANKMYGEKMSGASFARKRTKAAQELPNWYTKHAKGSPLAVPSVNSVMEGTERFLQDPLGKWTNMAWYQNVPEGVQPLQERDRNTVRNESSQKSSM